MLVDGIKPHYYCLPILKRNRHQRALLEAAVSGNRRFFPGTDSAPHAIGAKESSCGCAGCYTAPAAIELYVEVFEMMGALDKLEVLPASMALIFMACAETKTPLPWQKKTGSCQNPSHSVTTR